MSTANAWRTTELQALATIDPETLGANTDADYHFHYIDVAAVSEGKIDIPSVSIAFRGSPSRARKVVKRGDVLMATVRPNLKAFAYFDTELDDCVASTGFAVLRAKEDVDAQFVLYSILSEPITRQIDAHIVGSNYPAITTTSVSRLKILAPPFAEQSKIAEVLSTVDRAIAQTEALIAKQQRIKTGLMQDLLTRGIDEHGQLRSEATHAFKDSPLGRIPVEWECERLSVSVPSAEYGISSSLGADGYPVLRMNNLLDGEAELSDLKHTDIAVPEHLWLRNGDVLFNRTNSWEHVGRTGIWRGQIEKATFASYLVRLNPDPKRLLPDLLNIWLNWEPTQIAMRRQATPAVQQVNINPTNLRSILAAFPVDLDEQQMIVNRVAGLKAMLVDYKANLEKVRHLKTALMQDLLTGKVRVTPLLEPAEAARA